MNTSTGGTVVLLQNLIVVLRPIRIRFTQQFESNSFTLHHRKVNNVRIHRPLGSRILPKGHDVIEAYALLHQLHTSRRQQTQADELSAYIDRRYNEKLTLDEISRHFHFSKNHIIHLFRRHYGLTPMAYITAVRLAHAERLLIITSRTAEKIAIDCGFADYSHFYRAFRKRNRLSPAAWRKEKRSE